MVKAMRERIIEWGGEVRFGAKVTDVFVDQDRVVGIEVNGAERIDTTLVLSGVGHSARDTYEMLFKRGIDMIAKPFCYRVFALSILKMSSINLSTVWIQEV